MEDPRHKSRPSSATRFLGIVDQPFVSFSELESELEFDEVDVVWSNTASDLSDTPTTEISRAANSPSNLPRRHRLRQVSFGLSAAFSDDRASLLHRKPALNPSLSAATAARAIPPVPFPRSGSSSDDFSRSAPVDVPAWPKGGSSRHRLSKMEVFEKVDGGDGERAEGEEMLPPHEIVARSQSNTTSFSVFEGVGRTLKGRDMRRVRDAILQQTGFLE